MTSGSDKPDRPNRRSAEDPDRDAPDGEERQQPPRRESRPNSRPVNDPLHCPICEAELYGLHCKRICANCGYREDCSDLF